MKSCGRVATSAATFGNVNGMQLYMVEALACAPTPRRKNPERKYLYFPHRRSTGSYGSLENTSRPESSAEAKALCEADYTNGGVAALQEFLDEALTIVKAAGFRVSRPKSSKPKTPKIKNRVGPTFVAEFADGTVTRMSTFTSLENLDWSRGEHLSQAAYQSRWRTQNVLPAIIAMHFEQDGKALAQRTNGNAS